MTILVSFTTSCVGYHWGKHLLWLVGTARYDVGVPYITWYAM